MSGHLDNPGYFLDRLPRALQVVEAGDRGVGRMVSAPGGADRLLEAIETLAALLDHCLRRLGAPGVETMVVPAGRMSARGGYVKFDPDDDASMISHLNSVLGSGAFSAPAPVSAPGSENRAGAPLPSSRIPYEDRGRTAGVVGAGVPGVIGSEYDPINPIPAGSPTMNLGSLEGSGAPDLPPIPGIGPEVMQWLPTAIWAARKLVELIGRLRNK